MGGCITGAGNARKVPYCHLIGTIDLEKYGVSSHIEGWLRLRQATTSVATEWTTMLYLLAALAYPLTHHNLFVACNPGPRTGATPRASVPKALAVC